MQAQRRRIMRRRSQRRRSQRRRRMRAKGCMSKMRMRIMTMRRRRRKCREATRKQGEAQGETRQDEGDACVRVLVMALAMDQHAAMQFSAHDAPSKALT